MKVDPKSLTVDAKSLMRLSVSDRNAMIKNDGFREAILNALTPYQIAMMFPDYYRRTVGVSMGGGQGESAVAQMFSKALSGLSGGGGGGTAGTPTATPSISTPSMPVAKQPQNSESYKPSFLDRWKQKSGISSTTAPSQTPLTSERPIGKPTADSLQTLASQRRKFAEELKDPALRQKLFDIMANEQGAHAQGTLGIIESAMNRAYLQRTSLRQQLRWTSEGGYYDDKRGRGRADPNNPLYQQNLEAALGGSNITTFATDNSSGKWGEGRIGFYGKTQMYQYPIPDQENKFGGEQFTVPGTEGNFPRSRWQQWVKETQEAESEINKQQQIAGTEGYPTTPPSEATQIEQKTATPVAPTELDNYPDLKNYLEKNLNADQLNKLYADVDNLKKQGISDPLSGLNQEFQTDRQTAIQAVKEDSAETLMMPVGGSMEGKSMLSGEDVPFSGGSPNSRSFGGGRKGGTLHTAVDIPGRTGDPVKAVQDGKIVKMYTQAGGKGYGHVMDVEYADGTVHRIAHLGTNAGGPGSAYAEGLKVGDSIKKGQTIGYLGWSGNATEDFPHAHYEVIKGKYYHDNNGSIPGRASSLEELQAGRIDPRQWFAEKNIENQQAAAQAAAQAIPQNQAPSAYPTTVPSEATNISAPPTASPLPTPDNPFLGVNFPEGMPQPDLSTLSPEYKAWASTQDRAELQQRIEQGWQESEGKRAFGSLLGVQADSQTVSEGMNKAFSQGQKSLMRSDPEKYNQTVQQTQQKVQQNIQFNEQLMSQQPASIPLMDSSTIPSGFQHGGQKHLGPNSKDNLTVMTKPEPGKPLQKIADIQSGEKLDFKNGMMEVTKKALNVPPAPEKNNTPTVEARVDSNREQNIQTQQYTSEKQGLRNENMREAMWHTPDNASNPVIRTHNINSDGRKSFGTLWNQT